MLPSELLNLSMSEEEQNELVHEIGRSILSDKASSSLVWAFTKSTSLNALEYLLAFLCTPVQSQEEHAVRQALFGIEVFLSASQDDPMHDQIFALARRHDLKEVFEHLSGHCEADVNRAIQRINQRLGSQL